MSTRSVSRLMRSFRQSRRGLSEIVGTLMLIVIVVTAATLLSAFVASYEKQVLSEQQQQHLVSLEKLHVSGITVSASAGGTLTATLVSGDVNYMNLTDYMVDGTPVTAWSFTPAGRVTQVLCSTSSDLPPDANYNCTMLSPYSSAIVTLPVGALSGPIHLAVFTSRSNEFAYTFIPPVPIITATAIPLATSTTGTLFSGEDSYQPAESDNATLLAYTWVISVSGSNVSCDVGPLHGTSVELETSIVPGSECTVMANLTLSNSDGLTATTSISYES